MATISHLKTFRQDKDWSWEREDDSLSPNPRPTSNPWTHDICPCNDTKIEIKTFTQSVEDWCYTNVETIMLLPYGEVNGISEEMCRQHITASYLIS